MKPNNKQLLYNLNQLREQYNILASYHKLLLLYMLKQVGPGTYFITKEEHDTLAKLQPSITEAFLQSNGDITFKLSTLPNPVEVSGNKDIQIVK